MNKEWKCRAREKEETRWNEGRKNRKDEARKNAERKDV